jgi:hypothetical protein
MASVLTPPGLDKLDLTHEQRDFLRSTFFIDPSTSIHCGCPTGIVQGIRPEAHGLSLLLFGRLASR